MIGDLLDTIRTGMDPIPIGEDQVRLVHLFVEAITRSDALTKMAQSDGTKIIDTSGSPIETPIETPIEAT